MKFSKYVVLLMLITCIVILTSCGNDKDIDSSNDNDSNQDTDYSSISEENGFEGPIAIIDIEGMGEISMMLYEDIAPITVENFVNLVNDGFYDGLTFHRVIEGFMIQGGCPVGNGTGGPGYSITGEFSGNGIDNPLEHTRGVVSMARSQDPDSAGSQFFIMHEDARYLDGQYAAFGEVFEGMDIVDKIATTKVGSNDKPVEDIIINTIKIIE